MGYNLRRVFEVEEFSFNEMLSRNSSVGACSSRIYYCRSTGEGIPFKWEMRPGTPKDPPKEEAIPPLSPPPAILSKRLPKPCINIEEPNKPRRRSKLKFWRKNSKGKITLQVFKKSGQAKKGDQNSDGTASNYKDERFDFYSSDCEFMASPARHSSSSSSLSLSFSYGLSRQSSRFQSPAWHPPNRSTFSCSPWNISSILVSR